MCLHPSCRSWTQSEHSLLEVPTDCRLGLPAQNVSHRAWQLGPLRTPNRRSERHSPKCMSAPSGCSSSTVRSTPPSDRPSPRSLGSAACRATPSGSGSAGPTWIRAIGPGSPPTSGHVYPSHTTRAATNMMTVSANKSRSHEFMPQNGRTEGRTRDNYLPISTDEMRSQTP